MTFVGILLVLGSLGLAGWNWAVGNVALTVLCLMAGAINTGLAYINWQKRGGA